MFGKPLTHVKNHVVNVGGLFRQAVDSVEGDGYRPAMGTGRVVRELDGLVEPGGDSRSPMEPFQRDTEGKSKDHS